MDKEYNKIKRNNISTIIQPKISSTDLSYLERILKEWYCDNSDARGKSQTGGKSSIYAREYDNTTHFPSILSIARKAPRGISSAKE